MRKVGECECMLWFVGVLQPWRRHPGEPAGGGLGGLQVSGTSDCYMCRAAGGLDGSKYGQEQTPRRRHVIRARDVYYL